MMVKSKAKYRLKAFTVFELTVVIAILSTLITIIMFGYKRFNEQLKVSTEISSKLNDWHLIRANLWKDLLSSDSLRVEKDKVNLFKGSEIISYHIEDERFLRVNKQGAQVLNIGVEKIETPAGQNKNEVLFTFLLNDDLSLDLSYAPLASGKREIDSHFKSLLNGAGIE